MPNDDAPANATVIPPVGNVVGNDVKKFGALRLPAPSAWIADVLHDHWCAKINSADRRALCDCDPDIRIRPIPRPAEA